MSATTERENIMKCVLEVLEIDEAAAGKLATEGFIAPSEIHGSSLDALEKAMVNQSLLEADKSDIKNWKEWMACTTANGNKLPRTLHDWTKAFTEDAHDDHYINNRNMKPKAAPNGSGASNNEGTDSNGIGEKQTKVSQRKEPLMMAKTDMDVSVHKPKPMIGKDTQKPKEDTMEGLAMEVTVIKEDNATQEGESKWNQHKHEMPSDRVWMIGNTNASWKQIEGNKEVPQPSQMTGLLLLEVIKWNEKKNKVRSQHMNWKHWNESQDWSVNWNVSR